jgi:glycerol-3-phosphate dehydrogenase (NAD(P)+)
MSTAIVGAGAFGSALAVALSQTGDIVTLWARDRDAAAAIGLTRQNPRLPGITLPAGIAVSADLETVFVASTILLSIPAQSLRSFLTLHHDRLAGKRLVACCKGIDLTTMTGPVASIADVVPSATAAILTGPSFAADIARGLPTALTLGCADDSAGAALQAQLSTPTLRLYRTTDTAGAELGGALKNIMAIACGACIGGGFGESARAALMTRGFAEMQRLAVHFGARFETLMGLSGLGDLALTCTSDQSRNYRYGLALGRNETFDMTTTVEGSDTAKAVSKLAKSLEIDLPISSAVAALVDGTIDASAAMQRLLARPLKEE